MNNWLWVILLSIAPISELRGAIPLGIVKFGFGYMETYFVAVIFNILIMFVIFLFLDKLHGSFMNWRAYAKLFNKYIEKKRKAFEKRACRSLLLSFEEGITAE